MSRQPAARPQPVSGQHLGDLPARLRVLTDVFNYIQPYEKPADNFLDRGNRTRRAMGPAHPTRQTRLGCTTSFWFGPRSSTSSASAQLGRPDEIIITQDHNNSTVSGDVGPNDPHGYPVSGFAVLQKCTSPSYLVPKPVPAGAIVVAANSGSDYLFVPDGNINTVKTG